MDDVNRDMFQQPNEAPLPLKSFHKAWPLERLPDARRDSTRQVDAAGRQNFQCQIARFTRQNRNECLDGGLTQFAQMPGIISGIDDDGRVILRGSDQLSNLWMLRDLLDITKIFIDVWNPDAGTDVFVADVIESLQHVPEQANLSFVCRSKIGVAAFRTVSEVT